MTAKKITVIALLVIASIVIALKYSGKNDDGKTTAKEQTATPQPAPKQAETTPPAPAVPQDGKWVKSNEVEKTSDGKPIQRWTCDRKGATEPIAIWGLVTDYNVRGMDPIIAEFESYKGVKTPVFFNPATGERKLNSATGEKLGNTEYEEIGKAAKSVRFLPGIQDGLVSVEVITHR
jgi:hypothetical protein